MGTEPKSSGRYSSYICLHYLHKEDKKNFSVNRRQNKESVRREK